MLKYEPQLVAASAVYVASHILKKKLNWREMLAGYTGYSETEIRACSKDLCILFHGINKINLQAVKKKFSSSKFCKVGLITLHQSKGPADVCNSVEDSCNLPPRDSFEEVDIPDEGQRNPNPDH